MERRMKGRKGNARREECTGVVGELAGVDGVGLDAQELQRKHCAPIAHVARDDMRLDREHSRFNLHHPLLWPLQCAITIVARRHHLRLLSRLHSPGPK
jgi:hypothetical protein